LIFSQQKEFADEIDISGEYVGTDKAVTERLTLRKDGSYFYQQVGGNSGEARDNSGSWQSSFDTSRKRQSISVMGFHYFDTSNLTVPIADLWTVDIETDFSGRLLICFDVDTSRCFRKTA
jgi:hypothetical protein